MIKDTSSVGTITNEMMNEALEALGRLEAHAAHGLMPVIGVDAFEKAKRIAAPVRAIFEVILESNDDDDEFEVTGGTKQ